jgi:hypothetical protein
MPRTWQDVSDYFYKEGWACNRCPYYLEDKNWSVIEPSDNRCRLLDEPWVGDEPSMCPGVKEEE